MTILLLLTSVIAAFMFYDMHRRRKPDPRIFLQSISVHITACIAMVFTMLREIVGDYYGRPLWVLAGALLLLIICLVVARIVKRLLLYLHYFTGWRFLETFLGANPPSCHPLADWLELTLDCPGRYSTPPPDDPPDGDEPEPSAQPEAEPDAECRESDAA